MKFFSELGDQINYAVNSLRQVIMKKEIFLLVFAFLCYPAAAKWIKTTIPDNHQKIEKLSNGQLTMMNNTEYMNIPK